MLVFSAFLAVGMGRDSGDDLTLPVWVQSNWVVYIIILIAAVGFFMPDGVRKNNKSKLGHYRRLPVLDEK